MRKRITRQELMDLANEEAETAQLYKKYGLWRFARDEAKHAFVFKKMADKMKRR